MAETLDSLMARRLDSEIVMDRSQFNTALTERVLPILEELGVEGFVMGGYVSDSEGKLTRFASANISKNPAIEDGLSKWAIALSMWSAPPQEFAPPPAASAPKTEGQ